MQPKLRLNLGSGLNKREGFINVDKFAYGQPDRLMDLEQTPWDFPDNSVAEVVLNHTLEHLGKEVETFFAIMQELYRVCENGARIEINVPHPRHRDFMNDPTHVRIITPELLNLFSKKLCLEWQKMGAADSPLALYLNVDFEVVSSVINVEPTYLRQMQSGKLSEEQLLEMVELYNNIGKEYRIILQPVK